MTVAFLAMGLSAFAQNTVNGTVKDAAGEPIIGAAVQVQGTHNGAITAPDGSFVLSGVRQGDKLEVSCIGYAGQTITWTGGPVNVTLEEDSEMLEGTVVTALGIRKDEKKVLRIGREPECHRGPFPGLRPLRQGLRRPHPDRPRWRFWRHLYQRSWSVIHHRNKSASHHR